MQPASSHLGIKRCAEPLRQGGCDLCSACCTGSIPSQLGNLSALQSLHLSANELTGESNVCLGVSGTFVVSDGGHVSNRIHDIEE